MNGSSIAVEASPPVAPTPDTAGTRSAPAIIVSEDRVGATRATPAAGIVAAPRTGWYTFQVQVLFDLIERLDDRQELTEGEVLDLVGTKAKSGAEEALTFAPPVRVQVITKTRSMKSVPRAIAPG